MSLEQKLTRLERLTEQREAAALRAPGEAADPFTVLLSAATIEELRRLRMVFASFKLHQPKDMRREHFLSFATEVEVEELLRIFEVLEQRLAAQRAAGRSRGRQGRRYRGGGR